MILSIPREIQVGKRRLKVAQAGTVAFSACIYVNFPWDTGIVHSKEQLRLVGHAILVLVVCFAQRGHSHKAIRSRVLLQIRGHVKGPLADCHGILRRQEQVGDYRRNLGAGSCGEDLAILHIPQRNACGVLRRGQGFASIQGDPMHGPGVCLAVHQIELPVGAVIGQGRSGWYPGPGLGSRYPHTPDSRNTAWGCPLCPAMRRTLCCSPWILSPRRWQRPPETGWRWR